jgi:hypothetical protein
MCGQLTWFKHLWSCVTEDCSKSVQQIGYVLKLPSQYLLKYLYYFRTYRSIIHTHIPKIPLRVNFCGYNKAFYGITEIWIWYSHVYCVTIIHKILIKSYTNFYYHQTQQMMRRWDIIRMAFYWYIVETIE